VIAHLLLMVVIVMVVGMHGKLCYDTGCVRGLLVGFNFWVTFVA
jgi:hypothetical protein